MEFSPLDEVPSRPVALDLHGSLMVTEKLTALIPRTWEVEAVLSTVPAEESSQSVEQFQELVESGELLECKVSRGRDDVGADEALSLFARAAIGSGGVGSWMLRLPGSELHDGLGFSQRDTSAR